MTAVTWEDGVLEVVDRFELAPTKSGRYNLEGSYRAMYNLDAWNQIARKAWAELNTGRSEFESWKPADFAKFLAGKQHDYGTENITKFGHRGLEVRLWDKVARLENLTARGTAASNESHEDTLVDMIGYVIIDTMLLLGLFTLPLACDLQAA